MCDRLDAEDLLAAARALSLDDLLQRAQEVAGDLEA